jgi:hypothetical protein
MQLPASGYQLPAKLTSPVPQLPSSPVPQFPSSPVPLYSARAWGPPPSRAYEPRALWRDLAVAGRPRTLRDQRRRAPPSALARRLRASSFGRLTTTLSSVEGSLGPQALPQFPSSPVPQLFVHGRFGKDEACAPAERRRRSATTEKATQVPRRRRDMHDVKCSSG